MVTPAFLCLNIITILLNFIVGLSLAYAEWDEKYVLFGLFALTCWGFIFLFQIRLLQRYIKQYINIKNKKATKEVCEFEI